MTYTIEQIKELCDSITILNKESGEFNPYIIIIPELVAEVESLQKQLKEARAVIEFYGNWEWAQDYLRDSGLKAREWLEKWKGKL